MDTRLNDELLLPPLPTGRNYNKQYLNNPYIRVISRNFFLTEEEFFNAIENEVNDVCFSMTQNLLESQEDEPWEPWMD